MEQQAKAEKVATLHAGLIENAKGIAEIIRDTEKRIVAIHSDPRNVGATMADMQAQRATYLKELLELNQAYLKITDHVVDSGLQEDKIKVRTPRASKEGDARSHAAASSKQMPAFKPKVRTPPLAGT